MEEVNVLSCPGCGSSMLEDLRTASMTRHPTADGYDDDYHDENPLGTRGPWWELSTWCSWCGTRWRLVIAPHKASIRIGWANDGPVPTAPDGTWAP